MEVMIVVVLWMVVGYVVCGWALKEVIEESNGLPPLVVFLLSVVVLFAWPAVLGHAFYRIVREKRNQ